MVMVQQPGRFPRGGGSDGPLAPAIACIVLATLLPGVVPVRAASRLVQPAGRPADAGIRTLLSHRAACLDAAFSADLASADAWNARRGDLRQEYLYMLGLDPEPPRTPLHTTVTGTLEGDGFVVEKLHFQSLPRLYVTGNLYRPPTVAPGERLPAVLYLCGHSPQGRNGNKTAYQSHGIWFARHGTICLILDTLQLGEIPGVHHGTYREGRWWWLSRGYTPAGVECWNGIRALDLLQERPDVDGRRLAVTGRSGGGAATLWVAAADERVSVAVPVSGISDLECYVGQQVVNGHCDCMFLWNCFAWPWTRIPALVAPRPMLLANGDADPIFPMSGNERISARLERFYALFGASDRFDTVVSIGGHSCRTDLRESAFRFIHARLRHDASPVTDTAASFPPGDGEDGQFLVAPESLRVFPADADIPADRLNSEIDRHFVPVRRPGPPPPEALEAWRDALMAELRRVTFRSLPERIGPARLLHEPAPGRRRLDAGDGFPCELIGDLGPPDSSNARIVLVVESATQNSSDEVPPTPLPAAFAGPDDTVLRLAVRGTGPNRWTRTNPPNYVERSLVLLGSTVDTGRVHDVAAAAGWLRARCRPPTRLIVLGEGAAGVIALCAALLEPGIDGVVAIRPPAGFMEPSAPAFLNVLRVCDVPDLLAMLAPRPLTLIEPGELDLAVIRDAYQAASAGAGLDVHDRR